jgi:radical SAM superfamily enzyme YgiQ (UPF0313 family)
VNILLISANLETKPAPVYPLGVSRLATFLKAQGHTVRVFDCLVHGRLETLQDVIDEFQPGLVGLSLRNIDNTESENTRDYVTGYQELMVQVRAATPAPVVLGGPAYSMFPEVLLKTLQADFGIPGPGEEPLARLARGLEQNQMPETVLGLLIRRRDALAVIHTDPVVKTVEVSARVERDAELAEYYWTRGGSLNAQTQLGCRHACVYCTYPHIDGPGCRPLGAQAAAEDLQRLASEFGVTHAFVVDSVFNLHSGHAEEFCRNLIRLGRPVTWTCFCEPGKLPDGFLNLMAEAGCTHIEFGTDSLSDEVLAAYSKPFRLADILRWSQAAAAAGIHQAHFLILGGPGETMDTISQTFQRSREITPAAFFPYLGMRIFPHTPLHRIAVHEGVVLPEDNLLAPKFYFSQRTPAAWLNRQVEAQGKLDTRWISPATWKQNEAVMEKLRARGKKGPLWEYLAH